MSHKANYWLAQLDPKLVKPGAFRVLFHLCDHHNDDRDPERACFPSQETLRERTGMANGTLNSALSQMEKDGLIRRLRSTIPGTPTRRTYYILGCDYAAIDKQTPDSGVSSNSGVPESASKGSGGPNSGEPEFGPDQGREQTPVFGGANSGFEGGKLRPTGEDPVRNQKEQDMCAAKPAHSQEGFDEFWSVYPRCRNRSETEAAYGRAIASGVAAEWIIYAAKAYRAEQASNHKSYVCSPENWLDQRRWENFPLPAGHGEGADKVAEDILMFWAQKIHEGRYIAPTAISVKVAKAMLDRNLVTLEKLIGAGVTV